MKSSPRPPRVVVIGAGIVGASIAFHLSQRPVRLTVLDRAEPGSGASGHSFAWINASAGKEPTAYHDLNRRAVDMWDRFARRLAKAPACHPVERKATRWVPADVGLVWGGELRWARTPGEAEALRAAVAVLGRRGHDSRLLSEAECRALEPGLRLGRFALGAYSPNDGQVDPGRVIRACLGQVQARGGAVQERTRAVGFRLDPATGRVSAVQTDAGELACDRVVLAAGLGTTELAGRLGIPVPQQRSPGVVVRTEPQPPLFKTLAVLNVPGPDRERPGIHICQRADGTVIIGEGSQERLSSDDSQGHAEALLSGAKRHLPALAAARAVRVPVGYRPMPADGYPVVGWSRAVPNVYVALMHSGVTLAPLVGEWGTLEIMDGADLDLLAPYRLERFSR